MKTKGFTLIELLIVIAILAILATAVALVLNPAELLRQGRDSTRFSDMASIQSAISLYLADVSTANLVTGIFCTVGTATISPDVDVCVERAVTTVAGSGWVAVDFTAISGGSPLSRLPLDPTNSSAFYYIYEGEATNDTFELNANLESVKFSGKESTDGGENDSVYETGTDPGLDLIS